MSIKSWIINKLEKDVEYSAGHIELEKLNEYDRERQFERLGEDDENLTKFLKTAYKCGFPSIFCCSGHGFRTPYVTLKITDENIEIAKKIGRILSKQGIATNFEDHHRWGKYVDYRPIEGASTEWLNTARNILENPKLFEDVQPSIGYHEKMYPSLKPFLFDFKKRLLNYLRGTKAIPEVTTNNTSMNTRKSWELSDEEKSSIQLEPKFIKQDIPNELLLNIKSVNIEEIDLDNSFFHFTRKDNLEQIIKNGLEAKIGDASSLKSESHPRVYMSKGGKGILGIKNSFIHELKKLKICDIPMEYRPYFNIREFSSTEQVSENDVYIAMEKRFKDEIYFKVDAIEGEDFLTEDFLPEELLNEIKSSNNVRDVKGRANHNIEIGKLSLINTNKGNSALDVVEYLYNRLLSNAKKIGKEDVVRSVNSDLDGLFEYIKQRDKDHNDR